MSDLRHVARLRPVLTRSISAENPTGAPGQGGRATTGTGERAARDLGQGWKVSPSVEIARRSRIRDREHRRRRHDHAHLDDHRGDRLEDPAAADPLGRRFRTGRRGAAGRLLRPGDRRLRSDRLPADLGQSPRRPELVLADAVPDGRADHAREPRRRSRHVVLPGDLRGGRRGRGSGYLHAQWRRSNPLADQQTHILLEDVEGHGQYVGTYIAWGANSNGWWGEGEIKFYLDDDTDFPTIAGTGTEDYFGGAWSFLDSHGTGYATYSTPYLGMPQVVRPDGLFAAQTRFSLYRWHVLDPIHFGTAIRKVDLQALGLAVGRALSVAARRHRLDGALLPGSNEHDEAGDPVRRRARDRHRCRGRPVKLILDTDIGSDIDDAVCLAYLLAQPRCELLGITTVSGGPVDRARIASAICTYAGRDDIPILPGNRTSPARCATPARRAAVAGARRLASSNRVRRHVRDRVDAAHDPGTARRGDPPRHRAR